MLRRLEADGCEHDLVALPAARYLPPAVHVSAIKVLLAADALVCRIRCVGPKGSRRVGVRLLRGAEKPPDSMSMAAGRGGPQAVGGRVADQRLLGTLRLGCTGQTYSGRIV